MEPRRSGAPGSWSPGNAEPRERGAPDAPVRGGSAQRSLNIPELSPDMRDTKSINLRQSRFN